MLNIIKAFRHLVGACNQFGQFHGIFLFSRFICVFFFSLSRRKIHFFFLSFFFFLREINFLQTVSSSTWPSKTQMVREMYLLLLEQRKSDRVCTLNYDQHKLAGLLPAHNDSERYNFRTRRMFSIPNVKTKRFRNTFIMHFAIKQQS